MLMHLFLAFQSCRKKERNAAESVSKCGPSGGLNATQAKAQLEAATKYVYVYV